MKSVIVFLMISILLITGNLFAIPEWVAGTNVAKLIAVDNALITNQMRKASSFSNKQVETAKLVSYYSNRYRDEKKEKTWAVIKGGASEVILFVVLTFLAGKYLSK